MSDLSQAEKLGALVRKAFEKGYTWSTEPVMRHADSPEKLTAMLLSNRYYMYYLLFNKDFARALFGEESSGTEFVNGVYGEQPKYRYKYHLQQAVVSDDPIDYYYREVFGDV